MRLKYVALVVAGALAILVVASLRQLNGLSARSQPTVLERVVALGARRWATPRAARAAQNPVAFSPEIWAEARAHFADHCAACHANDGSGTTELGQSLYPKAPDLRLAETQDLTDGELYWIIENGVRFTGMPAWGTGDGNDADTWQLVHFIRRLKALTPEHLEEMAALNPRNPLELKEEEADRRFLAGEDVDVTPSPGSHHHD